MTWHGRLARAGIAAIVMTGGCMAALPPDAAMPRSASALNPDDKTEVARPQKPEPAPPPPNTAVCLISLPIKTPTEAAQARPASVILAVVNDEPILEEEVRVSCYHELSTARTVAEQTQILKQALERLIDREVILQDAFARLNRGGKQGEAFLAELKKAADKEFEKRWLKPVMKQNNITSKEEFLAYMSKHGLPMAVWKRYWERNFMSMEYIRARIDSSLTRIGHTEIAEYYESHREEYTQPDSVHWRDIFIDAGKHASRADARAFAESLVRRERQGEDFIRLSKEYDNGSSGKYREGDGQGHKRGEIYPPTAEPILFRMSDGDIEILEHGQGFHVIQLVKRQYAGPIPFDEKVQKEIHDKLRSMVFQREMKGMINELKRKAVIDPPVR